ncbi:MAG: 50S ribosomal L9 C-terminal domain-containing protein, partial [Afipia sp.]|nr:50S ribosomal L9 C-terminal domain-containing protein [Afipia sp.]
MTTGGFTTARNQVVLDKPIKTIGLHPIRIVLHPEVSATITVNVARTEEEANRQTAGEDLTQRHDDDEEEAIEAAAFFESEELAPHEDEATEGEPEATENKE